MKRNSFMRALLFAAMLCLSVAGSARANIIISEVDPSGSSSTSNTYNADWFELTNTGSSAVDITGWKIDDNSNAFATAVPLRVVTSINAGQSVVFAEGNTPGDNDATIAAAFEAFWFGSNVPAGFTMGGYGGAGVGLSQAADAVNIFDSSGTLVTGVQFGVSATGVSFDNTAGIGGTTLPLPFISTASAVGVHGAFASFNIATGQPNEIGSPGVYSTASAPEPSSIVLAGFGLLGACVFGRRRRAK